MHEPYDEYRALEDDARAGAIEDAARDEIAYEPDGGLRGTGRWYASSDVWFEIDPVTGGEGVIVYRCHIDKDDPDEDWESDHHAYFLAWETAVAAIPAFVAEERGEIASRVDWEAGGDGVAVEGGTF